MKKVFCLLLCMLLVVCSLAACGGDEEPPHEHTYDTAWSSNATTHWYAPTCEHTDALASVALHVDSTNDGTCDVCGYGSDHTHTYAAEWTMTETEHYKKVTCGHNVTPSSKGQHVDEDNNKVCDTCSYDYGHEHTYSDEWTTTDAEYHWHDATCGCTIAPADKALHGDLDDNGYCDVCEVAMYEAGHTHDAGDTAWKTDSEQHWKVCKEHEGYVITTLKGAHVDVKNNATDAEGSDGVCDTCGWFDTGHKHTFAEGDAWSKNDQGHWYAAACGHTGVISGFAAHTDGDDGACTVCGYTEHEHVVDYTLGLQSDANGHWLAGKCDVADEASACDENVKFVVDTHFDLDKDGECDACYWIVCEHEFEDEWTVEAITEYDWYSEEDVIVGYAHYHAATCDCDVNNEWFFDLNGWHEHTDINNGNGVCDICYNTVPDHEHASEWPEYVFDATNHWYYCDDCFGIVVGLGKHVDLINNETFEEGADGLCDVCGNMPDFFAGIEEIVSSAGMVNMGTVEYGNMWAEGIISSTTVFEFGDGLYHQFEMGGDEYWYSANGEEIFGLRASYEGGYTNYSPAYPSEGVNYLAGYEFDMYYITGQYVDNNPRGLENFIVALYEFGTSESAQDFWGTYDMYSMNVTFGFATVSYGTYREVVVDMYLNEDGYVVNADIASVVYAYGSCDVDEDTGYATLNDSAEPYEVYYYSVNQKFGDRTATTEHTADKYLLSDYTLTDNNGEEPVAVGDELDLVLSKDAYSLALASESKGTELLNYDEFSATVTIGGEESYAFNVYLDGNGYMVQISANSDAVAGTYVLTLNLKNWTKTITLNVTAPEVESVTVKAYDEDSSGYADLDELTVFVGGEARFIAGLNDFAVGEFTVKVTDAEGNPVECTTEDNYYFGTVYYLPTDAIATYTVVATYSEEIFDTMTVSVVEAPDVSELLNGTWVNPYTQTGENEYDMYITFTPSEEGALSGTCVYTVSTGSEPHPMYGYPVPVYEEFEGTYSYDENLGYLTVLDADGNEVVSCYNGAGCQHEYPMICQPQAVYGFEDFVVVSGGTPFEKLVPEVTE